jgi:hypothetical protein
MIIKPQGAQVAATANSSLANSTLVYIVNTTTAGVANIAYANSVVYANVTVTNTYPVVIQKAATDLIMGPSGMFVVSVAYKAA